MGKRKSDPAPPETVQPLERIEPGPRNKAAIVEATAEYLRRPVRPYARFDKTDEGAPRIGSPHADETGHAAAMMDVFGTTSSAFLTSQMRALELMTRWRGGGECADETAFNSGLALIAAIDPENELEAALAIQMAGCHALTTDLLRMAAQTDNADRMMSCGGLAVKMQRTFTTQIEALARMRGKGQQTVRVEHVTVQPGGQAIVGDVHHHPAGSGAPAKGQDQPHGTGQPADGTALPRPHPLGNSVPLTGDAERTVPAPRRIVARRAPRKPERAKARPMER